MISKKQTRLFVYVDIAIALSVLSAYIAVTLPRSYQRLIDEGLVAKNAMISFRIGLYVLVLNLLLLITKQLSSLIVTNKGLQFSLQVKENLIKSVPIPNLFFDTLHSGELVHRIEEVNGISILFSPMALQIATALISAIMAILVIVNIEKRLLIPYFITMPLMGMLSYYMGTKYQKNLRETADRKQPGSISWSHSEAIY
jgi:ABC-type bacteriocin/lantibiotic exporter with double-glycine peptidase domain